MYVQGPLRKAQLEVLTTDPTGIFGLIYINTDFTPGEPGGFIRYYDGSNWQSIAQYNGQIFNLQTAADGLANQILATNGGGTGFYWTNALTSPMNTKGDFIYGGTSGTVTRLAGDTSNARVFLFQQAIAGVAQAPTWQSIAAADIPTTLPNAMIFSGGYSGNVPLIALTTPQTLPTNQICSPAVITSETSPPYVAAVQSGGGINNSTGLTTLTFSRVGFYRVTVQLKITYVTGAPTYDYSCIWGGTGTLFNPNSATRDGGTIAGGSDDFIFTSERIVQITGASQTATMNAKLSTTTSNNIGSTMVTVFPL